MNDDTIIGGVLNQLGQTAKKTVQQVVNLPEETSKEPAKPAENKPQWSSDEERTKFLRDLYGKPDEQQNESLKTDQPQIKTESAEEQKKLMELRNKLHKEGYYDPTFNPVKKQEERSAEKVENEKKQEMVELQKKEENKPPPLAAQRAAQRVENLPGAG